MDCFLTTPTIFFYRYKIFLQTHKFLITSMKPCNIFATNLTSLSSRNHETALTWSLVLKVVFDVVRLQVVQVWAFLRRAVVKVVVDHVVHHVAAQTSNKHGQADDVWKQLVEGHVEHPNHYRGQAGGEDEPSAVEWRLRTERTRHERRSKRDRVQAAGREVCVPCDAVRAGESVAWWGSNCELAVSCGRRSDGCSIRWTTTRTSPSRRTRGTSTYGWGWRSLGQTGTQMMLIHAEHAGMMTTDIDECMLGTAACYLKLCARWRCPVPSWCSNASWHRTQSGATPPGPSTCSHRAEDFIVFVTPSLKKSFYYIFVELIYSILYLN